LLVADAFVWEWGIVHRFMQLRSIGYYSPRLTPPSVLCYVGQISGSTMYLVWPSLAQTAVFTTRRLACCRSTQFSQISFSSTGHSGRDGSRPIFVGPPISSSKPSTSRHSWPDKSWDSGIINRDEKLRYPSGRVVQPEARRTRVVHTMYISMLK
jgi:hypothetical protein